MKFSSPLAVVLGALTGFAACCVLGHAMAQRDIYHPFQRLHPFLEQETSFYPTASQLLAVVHAQCPPSSGKILVILGGNSVFNGYGQRHDELWSISLQAELGDHYHVVNLSAPGAGVVDNGGVIFEALAREYPRSLFVSNTEVGHYLTGDQGPYSYLFWDAYYKGLLPESVMQNARLKKEAAATHDQDLKLGRRLNSHLYFDDLWTWVSYRYVSTIWNAQLKSLSFSPRAQLPDGYDTRPLFQSTEAAFQKMPDKLDSLRTRPPVAKGRFEQEKDGAWSLRASILKEESEEIEELLPDPLPKRTLIVFAPYNPWFVARLTSAEQSRLNLSYTKAAEQFSDAGYHVLSLLDQGFDLSDFKDTVHLGPSGGKRLAHFVADSIRSTATKLDFADNP
jgi:hypothetical protein